MHSSSPVMHDEPPKCRIEEAFSNFPTMLLLRAALLAMLRMHALGHAAGGDVELRPRDNFSKLYRHFSNSIRTARIEALFSSMH